MGVTGRLFVDLWKMEGHGVADADVGHEDDDKLRGPSLA
jgi:hypothetical protein